MQKKAQFATEFIILFSFAFLIFLIVLSGIIIYISDNRTNINNEKLDAFGDSIKKNIVLAHESQEGFNIEFHIPNKIDDTNIDVRIDVDTLLIINTDNSQTIMKSLPKTTGDFVVGTCNRIYKENNVIFIEVC